MAAIAAGGLIGPTACVPSARVIICSPMETLLRYRGRAVTRDDVHQIRALVAAHPEQSRRALSETLCSAWDWRQANGASRAMVCRGLMLALWRAGHIELPAVRRRPPNPLCVRARPPPVTVDTTALRGSFARVGATHVRAGAPHARRRRTSTA